MKNSSVKENKKVFLISLGCAKNLVDSENILGLLKKGGFSITPKIDDAGIVIINTCGFIQSAVEECIETIFEVVGLKSGGSLEKVFVTGCFVQRYGYELKTEIPEVDGWLGTGEINRIVELLNTASTDTGIPFLIGRPRFLADHTVPRLQTTPFYSAYLKIAEGCSHVCSFCTIPSLRGPFRSRDPESIVIEAQHLADNGVKEVNLIAQDSTMYGRDLEEDILLEDLLEKLSAVNSIRWIRIHYCHPDRISDRLLGILKDEEKVCNYLDVPFQHVNRTILKAMARKHEGEDPRQLIDRIRSIDSKISLRTTLMVGFPGETEEAFQELYEFVKACEFDHLGVFVYSPEDGTPAAQLKGIPEGKVADERRDIIMEFQRDLSFRKNKERIGQTIPVLIEGVSDETDLLLKGRTSKMAPDVDSQVLINKGKGTVGEITPVLITEAHPYDLVGEIV